jgi:formiminotetrahydrofolate cyclodeaminase
MSAQKDYLSLPLNEFLQDASARTPAPGGGSVSALSGASGATMACMVVNYTVGKRHFAAHEEKLQEALSEFERARDMFTQLMAEDMAAYERFSEARGSSNEIEVQRAVATAAAVPLEIATLAAVLIAYLDEIKEIVNPNLYSDLRVAAILADACAQAAAVNVRVNTEQLDNRTEADRLEKQLAEQLANTTRHRDSIINYQP